MAGQARPTLHDLRVRRRDAQRFATECVEQLRKRIDDQKVGACAAVEIGAAVAPGSRVRIVRGALQGQLGRVITRRDEARLVVRLEGGDAKLVVVPPSAVEAIEEKSKRRSVM